MNRLPYRVRAQLVHGEWTVTCQAPAYSTTGRARDYDDAQAMANHHARTCSLLRAANAASAAALAARRSDGPCPDTGPRPVRLTCDFGPR